LGRASKPDGFGAMAVSLLPVIFMFFVSYSLLNRTLGRWFPAPEIASEETQKLLNDFGRSTLPRLHTLVISGGHAPRRVSGRVPPACFRHRPGRRLGLRFQGQAAPRRRHCDDQNEDRSKELCSVSGVRFPAARPAQRR